MIREVCVDTIEEALEAQKCGADQVEWCADLSQDGLTPDYNTTLALLECIRIPVKVMIRSRPGDFVFSNMEIDEMCEQTKKFATLPGVSGLVFGATTKDGTLDTGSIKKIIHHCFGKPLTIHKAIDTCNDILSEVRRLNEISGAAFILSSGGQATAWEGKNLLIEMQKNFSGHIIAAGKINAANLATLHAAVSLEYYHGRRIVF